MKIAMYAPSWPPGDVSNGIITYLGHIIPGLRAAGHDVFIITPKPRISDPYILDLSRYERMPSFWQRVLLRIGSESARYNLATASLVAAVRELVDLKGIELLEIEESFGLSASISKLKKIPVVVRLHGPWFLNKRYEDRKREARETSAIRMASFITSPTNAVARATVDYSTVAGSRIATIMNPITQTDSQRWSLDSCDQNRILFVGRFDQIKGGDLVLLAFDELLKKNPNLQLTVVGPDFGVQRDGVQLTVTDFIRTYMSEDAASHVSYLGEFAQSELPRLRQAHFFTINASRFEVFGYTVAEAMCQGCPVIASAAGGIPELIEPGLTGLLFEAGNYQSLVNACQTYIDSPDIASQHGAQAQLSCISKFNISRIVNLTERAYMLAVLNFEND